MKIAKIVLAVALITTSVDLAEAALVTEATANTNATTLQLPPPPPRPPLPRIFGGRRRHYVRHRRVVRRSSGLRIHLPPPPPLPPRP